MSRKNISAIVFSIASASIILELAHTRLYGVIFWNHFVYFIITLALLGFGISGTWLAMGRQTFLARRLNTPLAAFLFVATTIASCLLTPMLSITIGGLVKDFGQILQLLIAYSLAVLPYFFAGWILGSIFRDHTGRIHTLYFADLVGAGLGCLLFVILIRPLGLIHLLALTCILGAVPVFLHSLKEKRIGWLTPLAIIIIFPLIIFPKALSNNIQSEPTKEITRNYAKLAPNDRKVVEYSEWNVISRIDVVSTKLRPNVKKIFIDGDAHTPMIRLPAGGLKPYTRRRDNMLEAGKIPYYLNKGKIEDVLVIGAGGGINVLHALRAGARRVDAVEINPTTVHLGLKAYRKFNNNLFHHPGVKLYNEDGRSFVRRTDRKYDAIVIHAIDTFTAINSGAYLLSENYLYTVESFKDYIQHLKPGGMLAVVRWPTKAEASRLFVLGLEALYSLGIKEPERHIASHLRKWVTILIKRTPFTESQLKRYSSYARDMRGIIIFPRLPGHYRGPNLLGQYARHRRQNTQKQYLAKLPFDISPVTDDSPFFFHSIRWSKALSVPKIKKMNSIVRGKWPLITLGIMLLFSLVMVVFFMFIPMLLMRRRRKKREREEARQRSKQPSRKKSAKKRPPLMEAGKEKPFDKLWLVYFACLGAAFIAIEIAMMQRFALLLGHPSRSLALVLGTLLFATGAGSFLAGRWKLHPRIFFSVIFLLALTVAHVYPSLTNLFLPLPLGIRSILCIILVFPIGFFMGMPFPTGLKEVSEENEDAVPWMWGINGGTTVLGSILAIILAMETNFTLVLTLSGIGYAIALGAHELIARRRQRG